jgi:hypothetical protein
MKKVVRSELDKLVWWRIGLQEFCARILRESFDGGGGSCDKLCADG